MAAVADRRDAVAPAAPDDAAQARRLAGVERSVQRRYLLLLAPALLFLLVFYAYPVAGMLVKAFNDPQWGLQNFEPLTRARSTVEVLGLSLPVNAYLRIIWNTIVLALGVTVTTLLLAYPLAYWMSGLPATKANLLMILVLIPLWTSILVRSYAWMVLLGREGPVNSALVSLGVAAEPMQLLHTRLAVYVGMVHILLPFMVLPLYSVMRGIDRNLLRAADNLGASPGRAFRHVFFPLSLPGVAAGCLVVFILALGFYITPALLGGQKDVTIAMLIEQQVSQLKWGVGSALGLVLLVIALIVYVVFAKVLGVNKLFGGATR